MLNGRPGSGKDEFMRGCRDEFVTYEHSTIRIPKFMASIGGWDGEKTDHHRKMLVDFKKLWVKYLDGPYKDAITNIWKQEKDKYTEVFFTVSREGDEIKRIKNYCDHSEIGFYYIFMSRKDNGHQYGTESDDSPMKGCLPDIIFKNDTNNITDLHRQAKDTMHDIIQNKLG